MIKAIVQIGNMIKEGILEQFSVEKGTNLICLDFKTDSKDVEIKIARELTSEFLARTGYRGVTRGSGKEYSVIFPSDKLQYIGLKKPVSKTKFSLWNIKEELKKIESKKYLVQKIDRIINEFYESNGKNFSLKKAEEILEKIRIKSGNAPFYVEVCIDGVPLWEDYRHKFEGEVIKFTDTGTSIRCLSCGSGEILKEFDTNQLKFLKFFGKDKLGFFPELSYENQWKVFPLCPSCAENIVLADTFLKEKGFNTKITGQLKLLLIPYIPRWRNLPQTFIKRTFNTLLKATNVLSGWSHLSEFEIYAEKIFQTDEILIHIVVNVYDGQTLKIYSSLTNVPPSRIRKLAMALKNASIFISNQGFNISISLKKLYQLLSGKASVESKRSPLIKEKFAEIFKNLISGNDFPDLDIIKPGIELSRWQFDNREDFEWLKTIEIIEGFLLVKRIMAGFEFNIGGENMADILEKAKEYVSNLPIYQGESGKTKEALFFLGYIVAQIGTQQRKKGVSETILNKIQFRGMNKDQIIRLFNEVFEYMRIYDLQKFPENMRIMGEISSILDSSISKWNLSPEEAVYFILSGYAFLTSKLLIMGKTKEKKEESHDE
ncbi:TM1802 family CRISPR-associated protein [Thermodesulfatator atlanticus]|uniref:TM1802 family CRISPR-associated protein n=1 Tax=Thermodesulfatator atlanticus TaxID=501497 RepID=UPI0003B4FE33|nr:TM1802 family CRISPR-associated protein [Thermodesulfatator atlanticus]